MTSAPYGIKFPFGRDKSVRRHTRGNPRVLSAGQWGVSPPSWGEKLSLDTVTMDRITNLFTVIRCQTAQRLILATGRSSDDYTFWCAYNLNYNPLRRTPIRDTKILQGPKVTSREKENTGLPKGRKTYGNGGLIVGVMAYNSVRIGPLGRKRLRPYSTDNGWYQVPPKGSSQTLVEKKTSIIKEEKKRLVTPPLITSACGKKLIFGPLDSRKLIHAIADMNVLKRAYAEIKSKLGNITQGVTKETLDGLTMSWREETSKQLRAGKYRFGLARRILIPKVGKAGERALTIASPREKIVLEAITMVMTEIFEPRFLETSHGFRPGRSCHTALQMVDRKFRGAVWIIEADITKCFDRIDHRKLLNRLSESIHCQKTRARIKSALKAGHVHLGTKTEGGEIGTPQCSVLSPLLTNVYRHKLDAFMAERTRKYNKGKSRRRSPVYRTLTYQLEKRKKAGEKSSTEVESIRKKIRITPSKDPRDPNFCRVEYVRYADDFRIGVGGSRQRTDQLKGEVTRFLKEELLRERNPEKTLVTKFTKGVNFLGATISKKMGTEKPRRLITKGPAKGIRTRVSPRRSFQAPIAKLRERRVTRGYFEKREKGKTVSPKARGNLINFDHDLILRHYNSVIWGLMNYYHFADNRKSRGSRVHGRKISCAITLAKKHKIKTVRKAFLTFGPKRFDAETKTILNRPETFKRVSHLDKFKVGDKKNLFKPTENTFQFGKRVRLRKYTTCE